MYMFQKRKRSHFCGSASLIMSSHHQSPIGVQTSPSLKTSLFSKRARAHNVVPLVLVYILS
ncbi:hypothetical protein HanRHA438_Chr04g0169091 [Helianthus annuus]|nr:hypothetical protein HanRHA438_Chr04g0169091 [Helianthus annuus]